MGNRRGLGLYFIFVSIFLFTITPYSCLGYGNASVVCSDQERLALLRFKHSVVDDFGMLTSWFGNDCCMWEGIHCDNITGHVISINLRGDRGNFPYGAPYYFLVGYEVNSSLAELSHLCYLDMSGNDFQGSRIPDFIGSFTQLSYLNLSHAELHGIIPPHIGNLSNLEVLDLSFNKYLMADDMAWTFSLSSLEHLDLSSSDLHRAHNWGKVLYMNPVLKEVSLWDCGLSNANLGPFLNSSRILSRIKHLDLGFNSFIGPLPQFFQNMTSLAFLDLSGFNLSLAWNFAHMLNTIPSLSELHLSGCGINKRHLSSLSLNISSLSNIQNLDLSDNLIEGMLPYVLLNISSLRVLDLSYNMLNSSVPIMPKLLELDLSSNQFKQIELVGIWRQCQLKQLSASNNLFDNEMFSPPKNVSECSQYALERLDLHRSSESADLIGSGLIGPTHESLRRFRFLQVLDLSNNQLTGPIPTFLEKLSYLDLSYNRFDGSIPKSIGKLAVITYLDLEFNGLVGPIPTSLGKLVLLQRISVASNLLNGTIPLSIGKLAKLQYLDISNNSLEGVVVEDHFANLSMLKLLDSSFNSMLTFNVSREWIPPFQLLKLMLSSCNMESGFPQWLRHQRKLEELDLSKSKISGPLPTWLRKMPIIPSLDLSNNKISGPLTNLPNGGNDNVFGYGLNRALFLENNLFNESIPRSLCRRTDLELLDLSRNRLTGQLPDCLENMQSLASITLSRNRLSGVISSSTAFKFPSLRRLSLNENNFTGELPQESGNLRFLEVLDLGDNKFFGSIPEWVGEKLTSLIILRLHKNNFSGRIPESLCNESYLQVLDVAYNNLTGNIPRCLGTLSGMIKSKEVVYMFVLEDVIQDMKGADLEYTTASTLLLLYNMDLSSNNFFGEIPVELTALVKLVGLNLSNNHLSGSIPDNIGNMTNLESLDLSKNELTGMIPPTMAALTFLSHLNVSYNNLSGIIPTGKQLQTLIDPSIYARNKDLCGPPLPKNCTDHQDPTTEHKKKYQSSDEPLKVWLFYLDIMSGFAIGLWGVIGVLLFKKNWRRKLFMFVEEIIDKIYVAVLVSVSKIKRGRKSA